MVLQRDKPICIWGEAGPGESVTVSFSGQTDTTVADADGHWQLTLDPVPYDANNQRRTMTVVGINEITLTDIAVGDLWLWAGEQALKPQTHLQRSTKDRVLASDNATVRIFTLEPDTPNDRQLKPSNQWMAMDPTSAAGTLSMPRVFARKLQQALDAPIGVIVAIHSKTPIESWMSMPSLQAEPAARPILDFYARGGWRAAVSVAHHGESRDRAIGQLQPAGDRAVHMNADSRPAGCCFRPASLFGTMIAPLTAMPLRGVVWDHGQSNINRAFQYGYLLPAFIADWRNQWNDPDLAFLIVQLRADRFSHADTFPSGILQPTIEGNGGLDPRAAAELREAQARIQDGWRLNPFEEDGTVHVCDDAIVMEPGQAMTGATWDGPIPRMNYEIELQAKRISGNDFFCGLTFPVGRDHCSLILGGWAGRVVGLSSLDDLDAANNETMRFIDFDSGRWYSVRLRVTPNRIAAWLDNHPIVDAVIGKRRIDIRLDVMPSLPLGVSTYYTSGAFRNFRTRKYIPDSTPTRQERLYQRLAVAKAGLVVTVDLGKHPPVEAIAQRLCHGALAQAYDRLNLNRPSPAFESFVMHGDNIRIQFRYADKLVTTGATLQGFTVTVHGIFR